MNNNNKIKVENSQQNALSQGKYNILKEVQQSSSEYVQSQMLDRVPGFIREVRAS